MIPPCQVHVSIIAGLNKTRKRTNSEGLLELGKPLDGFAHGEVVELMGQDDSPLL